MRHAILIWLCLLESAGLVLGAPGHPSAGAQAAAAPAADRHGTQIVDGIAARIADDILSESEVRELGAFQQLVDGQAKSRTDRIRELTDQWILRAEADAAGYPQPSAEDVERAWAQLAAHFRSLEEFQGRCATLRLSSATIRRMLAQQIYLERFLDFRFRPAVQVDQRQIEDYYYNDLAPPLQARGQIVPSLESVAETIREVLVQRAISARAAQWLDETRQRVKIDVAPEDTKP